MSQLHSTKNRIKSIDSTRKITKAMELVASVKLKRWQRILDNIKNYSLTLENIISSCNYKVSQDNEANPIVFREFPNASKNLIVIITSSLGLCGGYNYNVFKFSDSIIKKDDKLILIGSKSEVKYSSNEEVDKSYIEILERLDFTKINNLVSLIEKEYAKGIYKSVSLIYTSYKNSLHFEPTVLPLLPIGIEQKERLDFEPIYEPNKKEFMELLIPKYLQTILYSKLVESIVSEQASRRNAMDNATDNADELVSKLTIQYNKARQSSITNELIDVVAGARNN